MNMRISNIATNFEEQQIQLEYASSVLTEVLNETGHVIKPDTWQAANFIQNLGHLNSLLNVTRQLLFGVIQQYPGLIDELMKASKKAEATA